MNVRDLTYIIALAEHGKFHKAAQAVFVSQSTLSIQIKKLEDFLGVSLFDRSLSFVRPTIVGAEIVSRARNIVAEISNIRQLAKLAQEPMNTTIRLGIIPTLAPYYLPLFIGKLNKKYPKLKILLLEMQTPNLLEQLQKGNLDLGILALPANGKGLIAKELFSEPFVLALPPNKNLLKKLNSNNGEESLKILTSQQELPLLLLEEGHCLRGHALSACRIKTPAVEQVQATSLETLRQMVAQGLGWTLIPQLATTSFFAANNKQNKVSYLPIVENCKNSKNILSRKIGLIYREHSALEKTYLQIYKTLIDNCPSGI